jgi:hypothetical protein
LWREKEAAVTANGKGAKKEGSKDEGAGDKKKDVSKDAEENGVDEAHANGAAEKPDSNGK